MKATNYNTLFHGQGLYQSALSDIVFIVISVLQTKVALDFFQNVNLVFRRASLNN